MFLGGKRWLWTPACTQGWDTDCARADLPRQQTSGRVSLWTRTATRGVTPGLSHPSHNTQLPTATRNQPWGLGAQEPKAKPSPAPRKGRHQGWGTARVNYYYIIIHNISHSSFPPEINLALPLRQHGGAQKSCKCEHGHTQGCGVTGVISSPAPAQPPDSGRPRR